MKSRGAPLPKRNAKRLEKRRAEEYGPHAALVAHMPCHVCMTIGEQQMTRTVPAHIKTRGGGGKAEHVAPLCVLHEIEWHQIGRDTFDAKYSVRMRRVALRLWRTSPHNQKEAA